MPTDASKIKLEMTCGACPEQYDAYYGANKIGYFRLRHGMFRVDYTGHDATEDYGETVYTAMPNGDGCFDSNERAKYLREGCEALAKRMDQAKQDRKF